MSKVKGQMSKVRVRIAPSPTGYLHLGTARTALYNFLFAKKHKGTFVVRVEDTDVKRSRKEYEEDILRHLLWLGLKWDEGPYRQSERGEIYAKYIQRLLDEGKAFRCFHETRNIAELSDTEHRGTRRLDNEEPPDSLPSNENSQLLGNNRSGEKVGEGNSKVHWCEHKDLPDQEVKRRLDGGESFVIRFATSRNKKVAFKDLIRGKVEYNTSQLGDFSLAKSLHQPLYNMACVIDDAEMDISHVIRGEDHIPNTPKQILLYEALGFKKPQFAHLPLILGPDERKLSKRHGAVSVREYKKRGYVASALNNFMALLGWHPSEDKELFYNLDQLTKAFSLDRVRSSGAIFDIKKLNWFNKKHLRKMPLEKLTKLALPYLEKAQMVAEVSADKHRKEKKLPSNEKELLGKEGNGEGQRYFLPERGIEVGLDYIKKIVALEKERATTLADIPRLTDFFFKSKIDYDSKLLIWKDNSKEEIKKALQEALEAAEGLLADNFSKENLEEEFIKKANQYEDRGTFLWPLRVALTGKKGSPGPFVVAAILGKKESIRRIKQAIEKLE